LLFLGSWRYLLRYLSDNRRHNPAPPQLGSITRHISSRRQFAERPGDLVRCQFPRVHFPWLFVQNASTACRARSLAPSTISRRHEIQQGGTLPRNRRTRRQRGPRSSTNLRTTCPSGPS
jgi:hypothetical protein